MKGKKKAKRKAIKGGSGQDNVAAASSAGLLSDATRRFFARELHAIGLRVHWWERVCHGPPASVLERGPCRGLAWVWVTVLTAVQGCKPR